MRILFSESETEELGTQASCSQVKIVSDYVPPNENVMGEGKRVSPAWLCFDREKAYQKNGNDYVKCNQPKCGAEFKLNLTTSINLSRHVTQIPSPAKSNLLHGFYKKARTSDKRSEIDVYLSEPVAEHHSKFDVLDYWRTNSGRFPNLSKMARDYLAVPGTSTPSERAFSGGRQLITDFRCRLSGKTITACMLLKNWIRQWDTVIQPQLDHINNN